MPTLEEAIATARIARGLSQEELAEKLEISQAVYSKGESGTNPFTPERIEKIAGFLDLPVEYFRSTVAGAEARVFHRKRASLPIKADRRIRAEAAVLQSQLSALLGHERPDLKLPRLTPADDGSRDPEDIADDLREQWDLGDGPIDNLVDVIEKQGIIVAPHEMQALGIDAIATWPRAGVPVIFLASHAPADRQRFTLAHEIGHAIMHELPRPEQEREADEFASEFLMPAETISDELENLTFDKLLRLKERWGVSMQALARRARDLNKMTERQYKSFSIEMSSTGMRGNEPGHVSAEYPTLVSRTVKARMNNGETQQQLAQTALMTETEFATRLLKEMKA